jgi:two-component system, chemotaxis family, sensor kinase CheA
LSIAQREHQLGGSAWAGEIPTGQEAPRPQEVLEGAVHHGPTRGGQESNVRVDVHLLERLMNLVGELVLARNQLLQFVAVQDFQALPASSQRLNAITTRLQDEVMRTRMQPIEKLWIKVPRLVRDLGVACGKTVRVEFEGHDTDLDRTILDAIRDPLTHLVRNAVDHGIEAPEVGEPAASRPTGSAHRARGLIPALATRAAPRSGTPTRRGACRSPRSPARARGSAWRSPG